MSNVTIEKSTLDFLRKLKANNNRDWFQAHKDHYERAKLNAEQFVNALILKMNEHDRLDTESGKKSLRRIYNDVRFSKDKSPYRPRFAGYLKRTKPFLRGGYYFWITPGCSRIGCGFSYPNAEDLKRIRYDIEVNYEMWHRLLKTKSIIKNFGMITGEKVRTAPRGFEKDHPAIELLKLKQYWFERSFTDQEVISPGFLQEVNNTFKSIRPFFNYVSDVLTTDRNGEPLMTER